MVIISVWHYHRQDSTEIDVCEGSQRCVSGIQVCLLSGNLAQLLMPFTWALPRPHSAPRPPWSWARRTFLIMWRWLYSRQRFSFFYSPKYFKGPLPQKTSQDATSNTRPCFQVRRSKDGQHFYLPYSAGSKEDTRQLFFNCIKQSWD